MCAIYNNLSICIYVYVCCDSMWSPNVAECRRRRLRCHCRHNGPVRPIDMIPRIPLSFRNERRHQDHDHDAWMIEIPLRLHQYYLYATTISWINEYANCIHSLRMWVCVWVYELSHEWMKARSSSFFLSVCLQPRKSNLWAMKHVQQFTCNQIVCMRIDREREERNTCSMFISFLSCTLTLYLRCSTHLLYYCWCFVVFFSVVYFHSARIECVGENCKWQCLWME